MYGMMSLLFISHIIKKIYSNTGCSLFHVPSFSFQPLTITVPTTDRQPTTDEKDNTQQCFQ